MTVFVEPLKLEDLDEYIRTWWDAFEPLSANLILPQVYPNGLQQDLLERLRYRFLKQTNGDLGSKFFVAKDASSGEIVGMAKWETVQHPPQTYEEMDKKYENAVNGRKDEPAVAGVNEELNRALAKTILYCQMEIMAGKPYVSFQILATHPKHQRRGVGTLLLKQCLHEADRLGLPVYLDASLTGRPLYERFGFKVVDDFPLNALDYGGRSDAQLWCMLRPSQAQDETGD